MVDYNFFGNFLAKPWSILAFLPPEYPQNHHFWGPKKTILQDISSNISGKVLGIYAVRKKYWIQQQELLSDSGNFKIWPPHTFNYLHIVCLLYIDKYVYYCVIFTVIP